VTTTDTVPVAAGNIQQLTPWSGDEGSYWAEHADRFDTGLERYRTLFGDAARIAPTDRVLDLGCGTGQSTRDAARAAFSGSALGIDLSPQMLAIAEETARREGIENARFMAGDAQIYPFAAEFFDTAISRTGAMFFADKAAAFANIQQALRPAGRLALLVWQAFPRDEWIREISQALMVDRELPTPPPDGPHPFSMSEPDRVRSWLEGAGFTAIDVTAVEEPMWFGNDADDAFQFLSGLLGWMTEGLAEEARQVALDDLRTRLSAHETTDGVILGSAGWLVTAVKPA
jgi:SAM-dependent methyltransferase